MTEPTAGAATLEITSGTPDPIVTPIAPKVAELKENGWTEAEIKRAEERGMVSTPEKEAAKKKADEEAKAKGDAEAKTKEEADTKAKAEAEGKPKAVEGQDHLKGIKETVLTEDQQKVFEATFGKGSTPMGLFRGMKAETKARQAIEKQLKEERSARLASEERLKALEAGKPPIKKMLVDEEGNQVDPDDLPLTPKRLRELRAQEDAEINKANEARETRARSLVEAQTAQEEHAREIFPDFDKTVDLVTDLIKNLDKLVPDPVENSKIRVMANMMRDAALNADKIDLDQYNAARICYDLGKLHPNYGKSAEPTKTDGDASEVDGTTTKTPKSDGALTAAQMKRIEDNTTRRTSSASVSGGRGKRTISADDMNVETLNGLSYSDRQRFKEKFPDRYAQLLRG